METSTLKSLQKLKVARPNKLHLHNFNLFSLTKWSVIAGFGAAAGFRAAYTLNPIRAWFKH